MKNKNQENLSLDDLHKLREAYRHFNSMNSFVRAINELIAIREQATPSVVVIPTIWKHYGGGKVASLYEQAMDEAGVPWRSVDDK